MKNSELVGIDINEAGQLDLLASFESAFKNEYDALPKDRTVTPYQYFFNNGAFGSVDAEILYSMIRRFKPKRVFEIGAGNSTYLSAQAILKNRAEDGSHECELIAIDPHPNETLKAGFPGLTRLIPVQVQNVPLQEFNNLAENDILFIDSSHVVRIGNDVTYEYLDIIPRLNEGVIVHAHDIFLPAEVPRDTIMKDHLFWSEQYLLQAFLAFNEHFEILWASHYMHLKHPDKMERAFNSYKRDNGSRPTSFWMRRKRE
jgi:predicted O-methyltransferase YrrM